MVGRERLELSIPKASVSKTDAYAFRHRPTLGAPGVNRTSITSFAGTHFSTHNQVLTKT